MAGSWLEVGSFVDSAPGRVVRVVEVVALDFALVPLLVRRPVPLVARLQPPAAVVLASRRSGSGWPGPGPPSAAASGTLAGCSRPAKFPSSYYSSLKSNCSFAD